LSPVLVSNYPIHIYSKSQSKIAGRWTNRWDGDTVPMTEGFTRRHSFHRIL